MVTKAPLATPLSMMAPVALTDRALARVTHLAYADINQHTLATAFGGPATWLPVDLECSSPGVPTTGQLLYRVPLGVTHLKVRARVQGRGTLRVTSTDLAGVDLDAEGALFSWYTDEMDPSLLTVEFGMSVSTTKLDDTATDARRHLIVSASSAMAWQDVILHLSLDAATADVHEFAKLYSLALEPLHPLLAAS